MNKAQLQHILKHHISIVLAKQSSGKTQFLCQLIKQYRTLKGSFDVWTFGLKEELTDKLKVNTFNSLAKLEQIKNSIVVVDEVGTLFELENRKKRKQIEATLRQIAHNNNRLILCGLPFDFKKFLCELATCFMYKGVFMNSLINGSLAKEYLNQYSGTEKGSFYLDVPVSECLIYDSLTCDWDKMTIPYSKEFDTKKHNIPLFDEPKKKK